MTEEIHFDAVGWRGMLIERENDDVARREQVEDAVERSALADDAESFRG